jgi:hypothetical protein
MFLDQVQHSFAEAVVTCILAFSTCTQPKDNPSYQDEEILLRNQQQPQQVLLIK